MGVARARLVEPLPWRWFEFRRPPAAVTFPVSDDPDAVHGIAVDGLTMPFKFFRQPGRDGASRPVLMLLHGMGLTIASFRDIAPYLWASHDLLLPDYSCFAPDHMPLPADTSIKVFAATVWRLADALGIARLSLAGNSLGGGLCLMATLLAPQRVERVLLSNPACFPQTLPGMYRLARVPLVGELLMLLTAPEKFIGGVEYIGYVDKSRFDPMLRALYTANLWTLRNRLRLMQLIRQLPADARDMTAASHLPQLGTIRQRVLLTWGQQDPLLAAGAGDRLAEMLPRVTYEVHEDLAHMPHEEAPERIGPRWAAFLNVQ